MTAFLGTFVSVKTMADGTPRITLDLQTSLAEFAALGLMPGVAFGIARITGESSIAPVAEQEPKTKVGPLCLLACQFCDSADFREWLDVETADGAKQVIVDNCGIESRRDLDINKTAGAQFHSQFRVPFMAWRDEQ